MTRNQLCRLFLLGMPVIHTQLTLPPTEKLEFYSYSYSSNENHYTVSNPAKPSINIFSLKCLQIINHSSEFSIKPTRFSTIVHNDIRHVDHIHILNLQETAANELAFFFPNFKNDTVGLERTLCIIRPDTNKQYKV